MKKWGLGGLLDSRLFAAHFIQEEVPGAGWNVPPDGYSEVEVYLDDICVESEFTVFVADEDFLVTFHPSFVVAFVPEANDSVVYAHAHVRGFTDSVVIVRDDKLEEFVFGVDF